MLALLVTLLVLPALLLTLANVGMTAAYTARVPSGPDAMGLIVPFLTSAAAGVLLLLATWICVPTGGLAWISPRHGVTAALATAVVLGVGLASVGVMAAWMERKGAWVPVVGALCGGAAPLALGVLLLTCAWRGGQSPAAIGALRGVGAALGLAAVVGYALAAYGLAAHLRLQADNTRRQLEEIAQREARWDRSRALSMLESLRESYARMSPDAPLWVFVAALPDTDDDECRAFIIARARQAPDFDAAMQSTLTSSNPRYRHGCVDLMRFSPRGQLQPHWLAPLAESIAMTARDIAASPDWLNPAQDTNPQPVEHIRSLVAVASLYAPSAPLDLALANLREALAAAPPTPTRNDALASLPPPPAP